jgi:glycosyltransferase involved in cell wall biosynthesis
MDANDTTPLVTCIMPTANRRAFVARAVEYFLRQTYGPRELLVLDDGDDAVADLMPADERVRYLRLQERMTVGAKRNLACEQARGEVIAHWDDDDWHAARRLEYQVTELLRTGAQLCGINRLLFYDVRDGRGWQYTYPASQKPWLSGSTLCYRRAFWSKNRFAGINVGEDARFVWSGRSEQMAVLADQTFHVGIIHTHNVSPKQTGGAYWHPYPSERLKEVLAADWPLYAPARETKTKTKTKTMMLTSTSTSTPTSTPAAAAAVRESSEAHGEGRSRAARNVYACLVHESQECVVDLVRSLRYHDPDSFILLYNGGPNRELLDRGFPFARYGATAHPSPRPMKWGWLHGFALDSMRYALEHLEFDTLTVVDSDQLAVRPGYSRHLGAALRDRVGMFGNSPGVQGSGTRVPPAEQAWREVELWRPYLRKFERGEEKFVHWTFWPSTVFTRDAARDLVRLFDTDEQLQDIMGRSRIWATEEIILPTLVALLGYEVAPSPCSYDYVRYRYQYTVRQLEAACARPDVFWMHPVPRRYDDALRQGLRARHGHYERAAGPDAPPRQQGEAAEPLLLTWPLIARMRRVEGWFEEEEADLLIAAAARALRELPAPHNLVEVGSYCGRATVVLGGVAQALDPRARVYSVDPHDGRVGALDQGLQRKGPTLERFRRNVEAAGLGGVVEVIQKTAAEVSWDDPVTLLLVDGLHDYANVAGDFFSFADSVVPGGYVAFHDYADYYPGVKTFVNELLASGEYREVGRAGSLIVLQGRARPGGESA